MNKISEQNQGGQKRKFPRLAYCRQDIMFVHKETSHSKERRRDTKGRIEWWMKRKEITIGRKIEERVKIA